MSLSRLPFKLLQEKPFLIEFIQSGLDWRVTPQDIRNITTKRMLIERHIQNTKSRLQLTNRVQLYPDTVVFALATINDPYCLRRLLNYLANDGKILFGGFNPNFLEKRPDFILIYLFQWYFERRFDGQKIDKQILIDYLHMALDDGRSPNLRIKSFKRLVEEHDKLELEYTSEGIPSFKIEDPNILPVAKDGYYFTFISNKDLLIAEAIEMKHCVATYANEIISGESVIYSITGKERATVEFTDLGEGYRTTQVYSYHNRDVSEDLYAVLWELTKDCSKRGPKKSSN